MHLRKKQNKAECFLSWLCLKWSQLNTTTEGCRDLRLESTVIGILITINLARIRFFCKGGMGRRLPK